MSEQLPEFIDPKQYPNFWEQMENFKQFAQSVGQNVVEGNGLIVSEDKRQQREKLCSDCSHFNSESKRCYICGCFMEHKVKFKASQCPIMKW